MTIAIAQPRTRVDWDAELLRVRLECAMSAEQVLLALRDEPWPFALTGVWAGGGAVIGARPVRVAGPDEDPFELLADTPAIAPLGLAAGEMAVGGGWFGWLGYGLGRRIEAIADPPPRPVALPEFQLAFYNHVLRQEPDGRWWFEALVDSVHEEMLHQRLDWIRRRLTRPASGAEPAPPAQFRIAGDPTGHEHVAAVTACRERIFAGDLFQANVCLRLEADWHGDIAALFAAAAPHLQPAYGAVFPTPWGGVASFSPELFLRRSGRSVVTRPIKGTIRRSSNGADATSALEALRASSKDHAEHVMIVDLMRNDLGRVCSYGTIRAALRPDVEAHPGVWHLVTSVAGELRDDVDDGALLLATFPPGSVTGAPKVQAMNLIAQLESSQRELYTGAIGFASPVRGLELSVAIRTFEARDGKLWLGAGGGIVADSDPDSELEECFVKARPLVAAIQSSLAA